jgi:hypothetical protein
MTKVLGNVRSYPKGMECSGNKIWCFLACALLLTQGCLASTNMASVTNPMWEPRFIGSMLIWVESDDLNVRREMEDEFEAKGWEYDIEIVQALDLFFPGNSYSEYEISETLRRREIAVVLKLVPGFSETLSVDLPLNIRDIGGTTIITGGRDSGRVLRAGYSLYLYDAVDQSTIWTASADTGGNVYAGQGTLRKSLVGKTLKQLIRDGIL